MICLNDIAIAVTTAPRKVQTLSTSIKSIRDAGFSQVINIFAEPESIVPQCENCRIIRRDKIYGVIRNWMAAAEYLVFYKPAYVLMLEDDILLSKNAGSTLIKGLLKYHTPRLGFLSLFTPRINAKRIDKTFSGWAKITPSSRLCGALGWCFPVEVMETLLRSRTLQKVINNKDGLDTTVGQVLGNNRMVCYQHFPSLSDHIGYISTLGHRNRPWKEAVDWDNS